MAVKKDKLKVFKVSDEDCRIIKKSKVNVSKVARNAVVKAAKEMVAVRSKLEG